jgi:hypothetical protein
MQRAENESAVGFLPSSKTDIAIWRPVEANWYMISSRTNTVRVQQLGAAGDTPALLKGVH